MASPFRIEATRRRLELTGRQGVPVVTVTETVEVGLLLFKIGCQRRAVGRDGSGRTNLLAIVSRDCHSRAHSDAGLARGRGAVSAADPLHRPHLEMGLGSDVARRVWNVEQRLRHAVKAAQFCYFILCSVGGRNADCWGIRPAL